MNINRREFLQGVAALGLLAMVPAETMAASSAEGNLFKLGRHFKGPVKIAAIELLTVGTDHFVRTTSTDGAVGIAATNERIEYLREILLQRVAPFFIGKDARDLELLIDGVYVHESNYKLAGLALWNCVGWVEFSIFDLLGKVAGKSVGQLMGGVLHKEIPLYMSSLRRDTTPAEEVDWVGKRLKETGCQAVKLKIGGRMSNNADAAPGRTEKLVALARKTWGKDIAINVDANGSYDAPTAIRIGEMLVSHHVYFYEEPCPFEDFEATRLVRNSLKLLVAGGEQDTSLEKFRWYVKYHGLDIVQPDVNYNGGFIRTARVARAAATRKMEIVPHSPQGGMSTVYMLQFASAMANIGKFMEHNAVPQKTPVWMTPDLEIVDGKMTVPTGPGLGVEIDPDYLKLADVTVVEAKK